MPGLGNWRWRWRTRHWRTTRRSRPPYGLLLVGLSVGAFVGIDYPDFDMTGRLVDDLRGAARADLSRPAVPVSASLTPCRRGNLKTCVVDGDTIRIDGKNIRIAGIDAPEVDPPGCETEALLGFRATQRLASLLSEGPFELQPIAGQDQDRFGRSLRLVMRDGVDLGGVLVTEGLARRYYGSRPSWC